MTAKEGLPKTREALPKEAFTIVGDQEDSETWKLPHHQKGILRALKGKLDIEKTVDWRQMPAAVAALSSLRQGRSAECVGRLRSGLAARSEPAIGPLAQSECAGDHRPRVLDT